MKCEKPLFRFLAFLVTNAHIACLSLILVGFLGVLVMPLLDRPVRFEEKGLLAGVAHPTIGDSAASVIPNAERIAASAASPTTFQRPNAAAALTSQLQASGLYDTHLTRTTVLTPSHNSRGAPTPCTCSNIHTRIPSRRGDGLEALAVVTPVAFSPQRTTAAVLDGGIQTAAGAEAALLAGASLALHLAGQGGQHTSGDLWLARDLLWVIPDLACGPVECLDAWAREYHLAGEAGAQEEERCMGRGTSGALESDTSAGCVPGGVDGDVSRGSDRLVARAGVIQQAAVLEVFAGPAAADTAELMLVGFEGLLPKLDMALLLEQLFGYPVPVALWRDHHTRATQNKLVAWLQRVLPAWLLPTAALHSYVGRLLRGLQFATQQAGGRPAGAHAAFKDSMIDAAGLRLVQRGTPRASAGPSASTLALSLAASLELTLRSLNNLVERMHHSPFLYALTGAASYVSVERYIAAPVSLAAALQLQAAWSMRCALQSQTGPGRSSGGAAWSNWGLGGARAAARTVALATAASALRALACGPPTTVVSRLGGGLVAAVRAAQAMLARPLTSADGMATAAGCFLLLTSVAVAAADMAGRLVAPLLAASAADSSPVGVCEGCVGAGEEAVLASGAQDNPETARSGKSAHRETTDTVAGAACGVWHAERALVLTMTTAALTVLVCRNWAAAAAAGAYLAPLALIQGWAAGTPVKCEARGVVSGRSGLGGRLMGFVRAAAWLGVMPLFTLRLANDGASFVGLTGPQAASATSVANELCSMSPTNYLYVYVVALGFWVFGLS